MRRTPLARTSQLTPGPPPARRTPLRSVRTEPRQRARKGHKRATGTATGNPKPPGEFTARVKLLVRKRAGRGDIFEARCEACGVELGEKGGQVHHRAGRGSGGCRIAVIQSCANALLLCGTSYDGCHGEATRFARHLGMKEAGVWIKHGTTPEYDPRNVPVMLCGPGGGLVAYLATDGLGPDGTGYLFETPREVAA